jgi:hypothetical protein
MGMQSGDKRLEQAVAMDMAKDATNNANPILGAVLSAFPSVSKRIMKNPAALPLLTGLLGKLNITGNLGSTGSGGNGSGSGYDPNKYK